MNCHQPIIDVFAFHFQTLRRMLDELGFSHVRIVAADGGWNIAEDILTDPDLDSAVDVIG